MDSPKNATTATHARWMRQRVRVVMGSGDSYVADTKPHRILVGGNDVAVTYRRQRDDAEVHSIERLHSALAHLFGPEADASPKKAILADALAPFAGFQRVEARGAD